MEKLDRDIYILTQICAATLLSYNIQSIPVDSHYAFKPSIINMKNKMKSLKNLLTNLQLMIYNYETITGKPHKYNKVLVDLLFSFWKLKRIV